jgi:hypothetical protein
VRGHAERRLGDLEVRSALAEGLTADPEVPAQWTVAPRSFIPA